MKPSNAALAQASTPDPGGDPRLDDKTFVAAVPHEESLSDFERAAADAGHWPVRLVFTSPKQAARAAASSLNPPRQQSGASLPTPPVPTFDSVLQSALRSAVRDELRAALSEMPKPTPVATTPAAANDRLTVEVIAREVHVTRGTVREWIKAGDLKASRVGPKGKARIYSIDRADLEEFLHRRRVNPVVHDIDTQADEILTTLDNERGR